MKQPKCSRCEAVMNECDGCGKKVKKGDRIRCVSRIKESEPKHYCSKKCIDKNTVVYIAALP